MFLKSKQKSELPSPNQSSISPTVDRELSIEVVSSQSDLMPKSILRDQRNATPRQLWDVDPREMTNEEKQLWKRQELEGEEEADINEKDDEDWNSEEEDPDEERVIAGVKVAEEVYPHLSGGRMETIKKNTLRTADQDSNPNIPVIISLSIARVTP
ncbi:unnamed protein product, partial [Timema podura]|nr:unnamed protein product [Timema podura]